MKKPCVFIFSFIFTILFVNCGEKKNNENKNSDSNFADTITRKNNSAVADDSQDQDTSESLPVLIMDSIYSLQVKGKTYQLVLWHELSSGDYTTTVCIVENEKYDTLYKKTFDFNNSGTFSNPAPGHYWLDLYNSGGGSGISGKIFNIKIDTEISLQPLAYIDELSNWKSNRTATEFVFTQAIWDMHYGFDSKNFETHFDDHRQKIYIYSIEADSVSVRYLGITKHKLNFSEDDNPLKELRAKEPAIAKEINWADYDVE